MLVLVSAPLIAWAVIHDHGALDVVKIAPMYAVTFACSDAQNKQLVARLSKTAPPVFTWMAVPCWLLIANTTAGWLMGTPAPVDEVTAVVICAALRALLYLVYVVRVLNEVCDYSISGCSRCARCARLSSSATRR